MAHRVYLNLFRIPIFLTLDKTGLAVLFDACQVLDMGFSMYGFQYCQFLAFFEFGTIPAAIKGFLPDAVSNLA